MVSGLGLCLGHPWISYWCVDGSRNSGPADVFGPKPSTPVALCSLALTSWLLALLSSRPGCLAYKSCLCASSSDSLWTLQRESAPGLSLWDHERFWVLELSHPSPQHGHAVFPGRGLQAFPRSARVPGSGGWGGTCLKHPHPQIPRYFALRGLDLPSPYSATGEREEEILRIYLLPSRTLLPAAFSLPPRPT